VGKLSKDEVGFLGFAEPCLLEQPISAIVAFAQQ
jgi:hypothetical protein